MPRFRAPYSAFLRTRNNLLNIEIYLFIFVLMKTKKPSPLQAAFWLNEQEMRYIIIICAIFLLGMVARYWYLKHEKPREYIPKGIEKVEQSHE